MTNPATSDGGGRLRGLAIVIATGCALMLGCDSNEGTLVTSSRDSLGIRISMSLLDDSTVVSQCRLAEAPSLRIGERMGDPDYELFDVVDGERLNDGRVLLLDRGSKDVRIFDASGAFLARLGREGGGPGEFRDPIEVALLGGDSIAVWDWRQRRISVYGIDDGFGRDISLVAAPANPTGHFEILANHFLLGFQLFRPAEGSELVEQGLLVVRFARDGSLVDTVQTLPYGRAGWIDAENRRFGRPLFESHGSFAASDSVLYSVTGRAASLEVLDADGELRTIIRWTPPDRSVTESDLEEFRSRQLQGAEPTERRLLEDWLDVMPAADSFPADDRVLPGAQGSVWIRLFQRPEEDSKTWWSFGADGTFHCSLTLPGDVEVLRFGPGSVLGALEDEFEVEYFVEWPFQTH